jgi:hypothetical protein
MIGKNLVQAVLIGGYPEMLRREDPKRRQTGESVPFANSQSCYFRLSWIVKIAPNAIFDLKKAHWPTPLTFLARKYRRAAIQPSCRRPYLLN